MQFWSMASGSSGNAYLAEADGTQVLVECGLGIRDLETAMGAVGSHPARLSGVLVTHDHSDHLGGARAVAERYGVPIYATAGTLGHWSVRGCRLLRELTPDVSTRVGELDVLPFRVPHDGSEPVGFRLEGNGGRVALLTDLGHVPDTALPHLRDLELLVLEANHDLEMLWGGPYPPRLKRRIAGSVGHLSNVAAAEAVASAGDRAPAELWLAHLSKTNNTPARALEQVGSVLRARGLGRLRPKAVPRKGKGLRWSAAPARQLALF